MACSTNFGRGTRAHLAPSLAGGGRSSGAGRKADSRRLGRIALLAAAAIGYGVILTPLLFVCWLSFFSNEIVTFPPERKAIDIGSYYSDFSLIKNELGWAPQVDLRHGLIKTLDYFKTHRQHYWEREP